MKNFIVLPIVILLLMLLPIQLMAAGSSSSPTPSKQDSAEYLEAKSQIQSKNYSKAIELLNQALDKQKNKADVYNLLGYSFRKSGDLEKGQQYYQKALELDPNHKGALEYQGELYLMKGDMAKARENLARLDKICFFGCEEYDDLKVAIDNYKP